MFEIGGQFDQPFTKPDATYAICSTPRTGSTLLATSLIDLGLGIPAEYLSGTHRKVLENRWGVSSEDYYAELMGTRTKQGIFGVKVHFDQLVCFDVPERFLWVFKRPMCIYLYRRDKELQAPRWAYALVNHEWPRMEDGETPMVDPSFHMVLELENSIYRQQAYWLRMFQACKISALMLAYEELCMDRKDSLNKVQSFLGLEPRPPKRPVTKIQYQGRAAKRVFEYRRFKEGV